MAIYASIIVILQLVASLLSSANNPAVAIAVRDQAITAAEQAVSLVTPLLGQSSGSTVTQTTTQTPSSTTTLSSSSIAIITPAGGEQWAVGSVQTITWNTNGLTNENVEIGVEQSNGFTDNFASVPGDAGSYAWTVGGKINLTPGQYQIVITGSEACTNNLSAYCSEQSGTSNTFTIVASSQ